jgi:WD40 repeat protein
MLTVGHTGNLVDADFSPDGTKVVSASFDNYEVNHIIVWDVLSGNIITIIEDDQEVISMGRRR